MANLFISYSRKDRETVLDLKLWLEAAGHRVWLDMEGIPPASRFREEIKDAIDQADSVLFFLSPDSLASTECGNELDYAQQHQKRIIPIQIRLQEGRPVHPAVQDLDWILLVEKKDKSPGLQRLSQAIEQDLDWLHELAQLQVNAKRWEKRRQDSGSLRKDLLLRDRELARIVALLEAGKGKKPKPTPLQLQYLRASREAWQQRQRLIRSWSLAGSLVFLGVLVLAGWRWQSSKLEKTLRLAGRLAAETEAQLATHPQRSTLLALESFYYARRAGKPRFTPAEAALRSALSRIGGQSLAGHSGEVMAAALSPDGHWGATGSRDSTIRLWNLRSRRPAPVVHTLRGHAGPVWSLCFSPDGKWLASTALDGSVQLWQLARHGEPPKEIPLSGHEAQALVSAFSPDGRWLVTGSADRTARVWKIGPRGPMGEPQILPGHLLTIRAIAISPDSKWLATASDDKTVRIWPLGQNLPVAYEPLTLKAGYPITAVGFSPGNRWLIRADLKGNLKRYRWQTVGRVTDSTDLVGHGKGILRLSFDASGEWLASAGHEAEVFIWPLSAGGSPAPTFRLPGHRGGVTGIAFTAGREVATADQSGIVHRWTLPASGQAPAEEQLFAHEGPIKALAVSPKGQWLLTGGSDATGWLWPLNPWRPKVSPVTLASCQQAISDLDISADGRWLAAAGQDGVGRLWELRGNSAPRLTARFAGHEEGVPWKLVISPDGKWLVTASNAAATRLWRLNTLNSVRNPISLTGHGGFVKDACFSPDSRWLVTGSLDGTARVWDLSSPGTRSWRLPHGAFVRRVVFDSSSHSVITAGQDGRLLAWPLANIHMGKPTYREVPNPGSSKEVTYPADVLAVSGTTGWLAVSAIRQVRLWAPGFATAPPEELVPLKGYTQNAEALSFSPDGRWLGSGDGAGQVMLWDVKNRNWREPAAVWKGHQNAVSTLAFSPGNHWLATGDYRDGTVRLYDLDSENRMSESVLLTGHEGSVTDMAFTADGQWLVTAGEDGKVLLWETEADAMVRLACRTVRRKLTRAEWDALLPGEAEHDCCREHHEVFSLVY